jgi:hypothetical protein
MKSQSISPAIAWARCILQRIDIAVNPRKWYRFPKQAT